MQNEENIFFQLIDREEALLMKMLDCFERGRDFSWPTASPSLVSQVWDHFARTGRVPDDGRFERIVHSIRDSVLCLGITHKLAGHEQFSAREYYEVIASFSDDDEDDLFNWIAKNAPTEPISDACAKPLQDLLFAALSCDSRQMGTRLKIIDRMLHMTHQRGDLSKLLIAGGRYQASLPELETPEPKRASPFAGERPVR